MRRPAMFDRNILGVIGPALAADRDGVITCGKILHRGRSLAGLHFCAERDSRSCRAHLESGAGRIGRDFEAAGLPDKFDHPGICDRVILDLNFQALRIESWHGDINCVAPEPQVIDCGWRCEGGKVAHRDRGSGRFCGDDKRAAAIEDARCIICALLGNFVGLLCKCFSLGILFGDRFFGRLAGFGFFGRLFLCFSQGLGLFGLVLFDLARWIRAASRSFVNLL